MISSNRFNRIVAIVAILSTIGTFAYRTFASPLPGAFLGSKISVGDTNNTYAIADTNYLEGGHMQVATHAAMLAITRERREVGMLVTVVDDDTGTVGNQTVTYRLITNPTADGSSGTSTPTTDANWTVIIPSLSGNSGKYLTTDGNTVSWATVSGGGGTYTAGTGLTLTGNAFSVNTSQNIATLSNLTTDGVVVTSGGTGTLGVVATTGTGNVVLATSPTLVTPTLGDALATTINRISFTTPATGSTITIADGKTFTVSNTLTFTGTDGSTLNVGTGGTLGTAAFTAASAYEVPLTFSTGLTRTTNTVTVNTTQNISTLSNLTTNGLVKTSGGTGALSIAVAGTDYQVPVTLTTTGTSGAATFVGGTLNIPQYAGATYTAGTGLTLTGGTFSVNVSQNITTLSNLSSNGIVTTSGGNGTLGIVATTGTGNVVLATSPTLVTPVLGAATATTINGLSLTANATGFAIAGGTTSKTLTISNTLTLAGTDGSTLNVGTGGTLGTNAFTSTAYAPIASPTFTGTVSIPSPFTLGGTSVTSTAAQLNYLSAATGTTGTGNVVFDTSPTISGATISGATITTSSINGVTPTTGGGTTTFLNANGTYSTPAGTNYTASTGLTLTGNAFSVNTSQNIATLSNLTSNGIVTTSGGNGTLGITATTGSGNVVLATSPTLVTPALGAATATSINGLTITASTGTLTIANAKTFISSNTLTLAGTDGSTLNVGGGGTLGSNAFTSTAYAPIASPTFTGTVVIPTPFTLGAVSVTSTGTQLNYLNAATGTTGSGAVVFGTAPSISDATLTTSSINGVTPTTGGGTVTFLNANGAYSTPIGTTYTAGTGLTLTANSFSVNTSQNITTLSNLTTNGGIVYSNASGLLAQTGAGSTTTVLHGGTTPSYGAVVLTTDVSGILPSANGGTGVNNGSSTLTLGGNLTTSGAFNTTITATGTTAVTLPTSGTLVSSVTTANGVSASNSAGALTFTLGAITPTTVNGNTITTGSGTLTIAAGKTFTASNTITIAGTDGSSLNIGTGGTLGTAAYTSAGAYEVPLTFSTGLTRTSNTVTVNTTQNITTLSNLTSNGSVQTSGSNGTLSVISNTGTGNNVLSTSPTLVTPVLGAATATSINGLSLTANATGFAIAGGTTSKTLTVSNTMTLAGTDGSTLNISTGGTLGTAAFTSASAYEVPLTFSTGLTRTTNTVTVNTTQNITTLSNLTTNGGIVYSNGSGVLAQTGAGSTTTVLHGGTTPSYSAVALGADVSGTLPVTNGGTGTNTSFTQGSVPFIGASGVYTQNNNNFYIQNSATTPNALATNTNVALSVNTNGDFTGTDAINIYGQYDAYLPNSAITNSLTGLNTDGAIPGYTVSSSRGTGASPTQLSTGDLVGGFFGFGAEGASSPTYQNLGGMGITTTGSSTNNLGGQLAFYTKTDGGALAQRVVIDNAGKVGIGTGTPSTTADITVNALGGTAQSPSVAGLSINNNTTAANNAQQVSPALRFTGQGWASTGGTSQNVSFRQYVMPVQGTTNPTGYLAFESSINGAGYVPLMAVTSSGAIGIGTTAPSAQLHVLGTTEQLRLGYDTSNYASFVTGSTGGLTLTTVGTGSNVNLNPGTNIVSVNAATPEERFTTTGDSNFARFQRSTSTNQFIAKNNVVQPGGAGKALSFTPSSFQYVTGADTGLPSGNLVATVSVWFYKTNNAHDATILSWGTSGASPFNYVGIQARNSALAVWGGTIDADIFTSAFTINTWHNLVVTFNAGTMTAYVDGNNVGSVAQNFNVVLNGTVSNLIAGTNYNQSITDQTLIYNRVLSQTSGPGGTNEIAAIYNAGGGTATPPTTGLIRRYEFEEGTGTTTADTNPNGTQYPLTLVNNPPWVTGTVPISSSSTETSFFNVQDGLIDAERGIATWGDFNGRNQQQGKWFQFTQSNLYPLASNNTGQWLFSPTNTFAGVPTVASSVDIAGNVTIGASYASVNAAPTNGLLVQGNVGIGTTAPIGSLDVEAAYTATANSQGGLVLGSSITGRATTSDTLYGIKDAPTLIAGANTQNLVGLYVGPTYNDNSKTGVIHYDALFNGGGNIGIGTLTPASRLDISPVITLGAAGVAGITSRAGAVTLSGANPTTYATIDSTSLGVMTLFGSNANQTVTDAATLAITGAPIQSTNVSITNTYGILVRSAGVAAATTNSYGITVNAPTGAVNNYAASFLGGRVGVGTSAPTTTFDITANNIGATETPGMFGVSINNNTAAILNQQQVSPALRFTGQGWATTGSASQNVSFRQYVLPIQGTTNPTGNLTWESTVNGGAYSNLMVLTTGGRLGIANTNPGFLLDVGTVASTGVVARFENSSGTCDINPTTSSLVCSSDMTLKKNINLLVDNSAWNFNSNITFDNQSVLDKIMALNPVNYNWKTEADDAVKHPGFIAQEVQQVFPDLVATDPNTGLLSLNYTGLIPYTVEAVKEMDLNITDITDLTKTNSWRDSFIAWFGNADNGITDFFSKKITTDELCVGTTCVTQDQFLQMIQNNGSSGSTTSVGTPAPGPSSDPSGSSSDSSSDSGNTQTPATDPVVSPSDPASDPTPPADAGSDPAPDPSSSDGN